MSGALAIIMSGSITAGSVHEVTKEGGGDGIQKQRQRAKNNGKEDMQRRRMREQRRTMRSGQKKTRKILWKNFKHPESQQIYKYMANDFQIKH